MIHFDCLAPGASRSGHKQSSYVAKSATSPDRLMPVASSGRLALYLVRVPFSSIHLGQGGNLC